MLGLRKFEGKKFEKFFSLIQKEAREKGCVFFGDAGMGKVYENEHIECEDMCGWLIPQRYVSTFDELFKEDSNDVHKYDDFYCFVDFNVNEETGEISIDIDDTPNDLIIDDFSIIQNNIIVL